MTNALKGENDFLEFDAVISEISLSNHLRISFSASAMNHEAKDLRRLRTRDEHVRRSRMLTINKFAQAQVLFARHLHQPLLSLSRIFAATI